MTNLSIDDQFLKRLKSHTETHWVQATIKPGGYGFRFQRGTLWNPGLADLQITEYEKTLHVRFPDDFRCMLRFMNGTNIPRLNVYGFCGEPHRTSPSVYAYPRDLEIVQKMIQEIREDRKEIQQVLAEEGFTLTTNMGLVPLFGHRYIVCTSDPSQSTVLSIEGTDAIVYGNTLRIYLENEFLNML